MAITFTWIDPDAGEIVLGKSSVSRVKMFSGLGMAPLQHFLQEVPSQHAQFHRGLKFRPRIVQLGIWDQQASAIAQDARHQTLLTALNADRGEGTLKIVMSDGSTTYYLDCYIQEGPDFASEDRPQWGQQQLYVVRFVARNPFLYNITPVTDNDNFDGANPVDLALTNAGQMGAYPTIIIAGAAEDAKLELISTGEVIEFDYNLTGGNHIDINCQTGVINYNDAAMDPLTLTKASVLFKIPTGAQTVRLTATAGTGLCTVSFLNRYLGI